MWEFAPNCPAEPPEFDDPQSVNPVSGDTTNWRAGCGKSARPVRREGEPNSIGSPYPYPKNGRDRHVVGLVGEGVAGSFADATSSSGESLK